MSVLLFEPWPGRLACFGLTASQAGGVRLADLVLLLFCWSRCCFAAPTWSTFPDHFAPTGVAERLPSTS